MKMDSTDAPRIVKVETEYGHTASLLFTFRIKMDSIGTPRKVKVETEYGQSQKLTYNNE